MGQTLLDLGKTFSRRRVRVVRRLRRRALQVLPAALRVLRVERCAAVRDGVCRLELLDLRLRGQSRLRNAGYTTRLPIAIALSRISLGQREALGTLTL